MTKIKSFLNSINWKVRVKNKVFWISLIPTVLILLGKVLALFGIDFDYIAISNELVDIVEALFVLLGLVGVVADPTTQGIGDSTQALTYTAPKSK